MADMISVQEELIAFKDVMTGDEYVVEVVCDNIIPLDTKNISKRTVLRIYNIVNQEGITIMHRRSLLTRWLGWIKLSLLKRKYFKLYKFKLDRLEKMNYRNLTFNINNDVLSTFIKFDAEVTADTQGIILQHGIYYKERK